MEMRRWEVARCRVVWWCGDDGLTVLAREKKRRAEGEVERQRGMVVRGTTTKLAMAQGREGGEVQRLTVVGWRLGGGWRGRWGGS